MAVAEASPGGAWVGEPLVIFDLDGVLVDSEVISAAVLIELAAEAGVAFDAPYVRAHFLGRSFPTVARDIRERFGVALDPGFEAAYRARLLARFDRELRVTAGLGAALGRLRARACVATSSSPERAARTLAAVGLDRAFPRVFTASEVSRGKPEPDLFLHAARAMGADPAACLVIEDSRPGLLAARAAGMVAAHFLGASHLAGVPGGFDIDPPPLAFRDWAGLADGFPAHFGPSDEPSGGPPGAAPPGGAPP